MRYADAKHSRQRRGGAIRDWDVAVPDSDTRGAGRPDGSALYGDPRREREL